MQSKKEGSKKSSGGGGGEGGVVGQNLKMGARQYSGN